MEFLIWGLALLSSMTDAFADAKEDMSGNKHHLAEALMVLFYVIFGAISMWFFFPVYGLLYTILITIATITLARTSCFNLTYNGVRKLNSGYIGTTSKIDQLIDSIAIYGRILNKKTWPRYIAWAKDFICGGLEFMPILIYGITFIGTIVFLLVLR